MNSRFALAALVSTLLLGGVGAAVSDGQTPAGPVPTSFGDEPGALRLPEAVAIAPNGDVLVGDHFGGRIQRFRDGRYVGSFGVRGQGCGRLGAIGGVAVDDQGKAYVLDTDQQLVQIFSADGQSLRCFGGKGQAPGRLSTTSGSYAASSASGGIAVGGGSIYVADAGNDRIQRFTLTGKHPKIIGKGKLSRPQGVAVQGQRLLVADDAHHRVVEFTTSGRLVREASRATGVRLRFPYDVAFAKAGGAYVADNNLHRIVQLDRHLRRVRTWGSEGHGHGRFVFPRAVAITAAGHVLVADAGNDRVQEFTATGGFVRTLGINGRERPHLTAPADVAVNAFGEVAAADGNGRLSWFDLAGHDLGAWAQSHSFQTSTAVVTSPEALAFATDRTLRVADQGAVRDYAAGSTREVVPWTPPSAPSASLDVGPTGTTWVLQTRGQFARLGADGTPRPWGGPTVGPNRSATAIAELADGTIAVAEGTSPHQERPADGTVSRVAPGGSAAGGAAAGNGATGSGATTALTTWTVPRPPGGQPSRPVGLAATPDGGFWVADAANDRLLRFAADGAVAQTLGEPGTGPTQLANPRGLAFACDGSLLVADAGNNRVVRYPNLGPATGCAAAGIPTPAAGHPPAAVGLRLRTAARAKRPATKLGTFAARCVRTCTLRVTEVQAGSAAGRTFKTLHVTATVTGHQITLRASQATVAAMRSAIRHGGQSGVGVIVTATAPDGVIDTAGAAWQFS